MTHGLLDNTDPHCTQLQQHSTGNYRGRKHADSASTYVGPTRGTTTWNKYCCNPEDHKEKRRKIDAKYRHGCKTRREELRVKLQNLREENARLKREKESCWKEDNSMAQKLQSKELEIGHLKREIGDSKKVISVQTNLLETLSQNPLVQQLMLGPNRLEMVLLENECNKLCQNGKWYNWASERVELLNEIKQLRLRNMMLKMHNQALVDKMLNQKDYKRKHEKDI